MMRLHHLEIVAFGPFADSVSVDFDALSDGGLFLLTGATGAGKTSVLDAVCFALYGDVPGDRASAKRLRSDQAAAGVAPRVTLECTLAGRRFRLVRSPAWARPKKRGEGTTVQQASVSVSERIEGRWVPLSSRLDETGHLVSGLLGLNLTQFTQVAMLPQGRFQAFLRARSEDRHRLLQQVFRTGRFEGVERWLRDHRLTLSADSRAHQLAVADLVSRLSETADAVAPAEWDGPALALAADHGEVGAWAEGLVLQGRADAERASAGRHTARGAADAAAAALLAARSLADRQRRLEEARREHGRLLARAGEIQDGRARLVAGRRAAGLLPLHRAVEDARAVAEAARGDLARALGDAVTQVGELAGDEQSLRQTQADALRAAAEVTAALPLQERLTHLAATVAQARESRLRAQERADRLQALLAAAPAQVEALRGALDEAARASAAAPAAEAACEAARSRLDAARAVPVLAAELEQARELLRAATDLAQARKEEWLTIQERRITGMAAELAGRIAVGESCPVCGSAEHPHLAQPPTGAPDAAAEKEARRLLDDAETERHLHDLAVRDADTVLALTVRAADGAELAAAAAGLERATTEHARLTALAAQHGDLTQALAEVEESRADSQARREALLGEIVELDTRIATGEAEAARIALTVGALLEPTDCTDLAALRDRHESTARCCGVAVRARQAADAAEEHLREARSRIAQAARRAGFSDTRGALAAAVPDAELADLEAALLEHDSALATQTLVLADPELQAAAGQPAPDLAALTQAAAETADELTRREAAAELSLVRSARLDTLSTRLAAALASWAPVRADLDLATRLAQLVDGRSPDNRLQMRLSAYVLAYRLRQVVAAANERLVVMSDCRYSLEHTAQRGAGETRGGLSLTVRDDWSGEARDPATLSGGETFVVSLALALGLADVITDEAGGADLDTLFVDEGFGALDADTLEDVMDTLDSLRDGGRVVGVVSHVPEMQHRIPTQLAVVKGRAGSTVRPVRPGVSASC